MKFRPYDQSQTRFITLDYRSILGEDSDAVLVNDIVEYLDLSAIENKYHEVGNLGYHPKAMVKILFWGYYKSHFGGRPLWRQYQTDLALRYFSNDDFPDHRTLNNFRVKFKKELMECFAQIVMLCGELDIIGFENLCIDSQKIKANASLFQNKNLTGIRKEQERIKKQFATLLDNDIEVPESTNNVQKKCSKLQQRNKKLEDAANILIAAGGDTDEKLRYNLTDPDSRIMTDKRGVKNPDYNCHTSVDDKYGVITGIKVTNNCTDKEELQPMKDESKKNIGRPHNHTCADCGYVTNQLYPMLEKDTETEYFVPDRTMHSSKKLPYSKWNFIHDPLRDVFLCPEGRELHFLREEKNTHGNEYRLYRGVNCHDCPSREKCLKPRKKNSNDPTTLCRTISVFPEDLVIKRMRDKLNSTEGKAIYRRRMVTAEPVNGDIQKNRGFYQFFLRGFDKVNLEYTLLGIANNIRKIILHAAHAFREMIKVKNESRSTC